MKAMQEAVVAHLQRETGIHTVCDRSTVAGEYPLLTVEIREQGTTLLAGGQLAEHCYAVTVTALSDRERQGNTALLSDLVPVLLRGVPMETPEGGRMLRPLDIRTEEEALTFKLDVCAVLPHLLPDGERAAEPMQTLYFGV